ncbi:MAG: putative CRISPR-associated protein [Cyanobacteria bacterium CRU_2_1]|nr:putative CRISPR-associated protein [Cyanobacteria bacterium CRU_2_1]
MQTIITTTGTSLLANASRELKKKSAEVTNDELRHFFEQVGVEAACAETNSLLKVAKAEDEIVLLYTKTSEGKRCCQQVEQYLTSKGWKRVRSRQLVLEQKEEQFERYGLRHLVDTLVEEIEQAQRRKQDVVINATGGFKAEIAYTTMVGMIFQVPVKYIYQGFQQPITFPSLPIAWNTDLLLAYNLFFDWIDTEPRPYEEVEEWLKSIAEADRTHVRQFLLPPDSENNVFLSPAGDILWKWLQHQYTLAELANDPDDSQIPIAKKLSSSLKDEKHHFPKGTKKIVEKIAEISAVEEIIGGHFENTTLTRIKGIDESGVIRVLWADSEKATNLMIRTTARGKAQTLRVCNRYLCPVLDLPTIKNNG